MFFYPQKQRCGPRIEKEKTRLSRSSNKYPLQLPSINYPELQLFSVDRMESVFWGLALYA